MFVLLCLLCLFSVAAIVFVCGFFRVVFASLVLFGFVFLFSLFSRGLVCVVLFVLCVVCFVCFVQLTLLCFGCVC